MTVPATRARAKAARSKAVVSRSRNSSRPMTVILNAKVITAAGSISSGWTRPAAPTASRVAEKKATARARPKAAPSSPLVPDAHQARARATGAAAAVASAAPRAMRPSSVMLPASRTSFPRRTYPPLVAAPPRRGSGRRIYQALRQACQSPGGLLTGARLEPRALQRSGAPADTQRVRARLLALVLAVLLAACGGAGKPAASPSHDQLVGTADVERLLVSTQKRKSPNLEVGAATCPDQVRLANGTRFTCTVLIEGTKATGRFALAPAKPIIDVSRIVALIRSKLQPTARAATVRCGKDKVQVVEVGASIACTITLGDAVQKVTAEVRDLKGTVVVRG